MSDRTFTVTLPDDVFEPGRTFGWRHVDVAIWAGHLTVERFQEIAKAKGAVVGAVCWQVDCNGQGPIMDAKWSEDGVNVVLHGPVHYETAAIAA